MRRSADAIRLTAAYVFARSRGSFALTAFAPALPSPLRKTAPYGRPVHRLGDRAGRSPGSRVFVARRPSQLPSGRFDERLAAHSCGGSRGFPLCLRAPRSLFRLRRKPENQHVEMLAWRRVGVKTARIRTKRRAQFFGSM